MKRLLRFWCLAVSLTLAISICFADQPKRIEEPKLIPREVIFGNPVNTSPQVSPDGTMLAYLAPLDGVLNVWIKTLGKEDQRPITHDRDRGIQIYSWAYDGRHIIYLQDVGGNENWRLYAADVTTGETRDLTPFENVQVRVVDLSRSFPDKILIAMNMDDPRFHDVYLLDLATGAMEMVAKNPGNFAGWLADANLEIKGALAMRQDGGSDLLVREDRQSDWKTLVSWDSQDVLTSSPQGFSKDGKYLYLIDSRNANTGRLTKINIATGEFEVLAEDSVYDVSYVVTNPQTYQPEAVAFLKARMEWHVLDKSLERDFKAILEIDHGDLAYIHRDDNSRIWIVGFTKDDGPFSFYVYDSDSKKATFLFDSRPILRQYQLAPMEPIAFEASDGLIIHGYITYPIWKERKNLPLVVFVHGGPWARDTWGYDPEAQWLANRGYACLQVNFRGSSGYGKKFLNAGDREWGGKMHQDIVDAVNWAISQGIADPERIAIYGGSYGGYEALVAATFTPDLFSCAVDVVGPSNLLTWITSIPPYWTAMREILYKRIGNPDTEPEFLKSRSPLFRVDQIKIPMLIAQGANDPRVPKEESEQIVNQLKQRGIYHEYLLFEDEGHGFAKPENRLRFYAAAEKFLARCLGGRVEE